jgi:hypothetical protein
MGAGVKLFGCKGRTAAEDTTLQPCTLDPRGAAVGATLLMQVGPTFDATPPTMILLISGVAALLDLL